MSISQGRHRQLVEQESGLKQQAHFGHPTGLPQPGLFLRPY